MKSLIIRIAFSAGLTTLPAMAQQVTGVPGSPSATATIDGKQLPPPDPKFGGTIKEKAAESKAWWPPRVVPPKGAPNVLLIMTDDCGFGAPGTFGGVVPTPALDRIAKSGLRYTQFHSTSLCSPTRAALITGRNHHAVGYGVVGESATGFPGYNSIIGKECGTIGEILKEHGYATSWFGKNHNTPFYLASQAGPFDQWPIGMGFEYFYGFVGGDTSQWQPNLFRNTTAIYPFAGKPGWNLTTAMADDAIQQMKQLSEIAPDKPFFVYYVPGGTHSPHHPTPEWIKKVSDMHLFDQGWNKLRDTTFANQKKLGIMPADAKLTAWPKDLPEWDSLDFDAKKLFIKQADGGDVFARRSEFIDPPPTFEAGARVSFETYKGPKGICAEQVRFIAYDGRHLEHGFIESTPRTDFSFIRPDDNGPSVFVHSAECDFPPEPGQRVTYLLSTDRSGRARAAVCRKE
jgi:arylsulfatase